MKFLDNSEIGPIRRFTDADLYWSLYTVNVKGPISRSDLAASVGVGEGSMRNMLSYLKDWELINVKRAGVIITDEGRELLDLMPMKPIELDIPKYVRGTEHQGMLVKGFASAVTNGAHQCDVGIRSGAIGCTTFIIRGGCVILSPDWNLDEKDPITSEKIKLAVNPSEGDVILLGFGNDWSSAMRAAVRASLDML